MGDGVVMGSREGGSRLTHVILHPYRVQRVPRTRTDRWGGTRAAPGRTSPCRPSPASGRREGSGSLGFFRAGDCIIYPAR